MLARPVVGLTIGVTRWVTSMPLIVATDWLPPPTAEVTTEAAWNRVFTPSTRIVVGLDHGELGQAK